MVWCASFLLCSVSLEHNSLVNSYVLCWTLSEFGTMLHIAYQCTFIYKMMKCRNTFWLMYSKLKISIKDKQDSSENTFDIRRLLSYTRTTARVRSLTNQRRVFYRWGLDGKFGPILRMIFKKNIIHTCLCLKWINTILFFIEECICLEKVHYKNLQLWKEYPRRWLLVSVAWESTGLILQSMVICNSADF